MIEQSTADRLPASEAATSTESAISKLEDVFRMSESLAPDDRLRLIVRLWATLPPDHWGAPTAHELAQVARRLNDYEARRIADPPWEIVGNVVLQQLAHHRKPPSAKIYSAPRRFDLATVFIATTAYSILFAGMTLLDFWPIIKLYIGALITLVGAGQALLMNVLDPRRASVLVGVSVHTTFSLFLYAMDSDIFLDSLILAVLFSGVLGGAIFGYLAGALAAGVFLVADVLRGKFELTPAIDEEQTQAAELPVEPSQEPPLLTPID